MASCRALSPFTCANDDQCTLYRLAGVCVMPQRACAFPANDCPSGYRFDQTAGVASSQCATIDPLEQQGDMGSGGGGGDMPTAAPSPSVAMVMPARGPTSGGTNIAISGANFLPGAVVSVGGSPALN
ncbi:MAG: IPT/TIG domain-containing protein, partial [Candidatus Eremiobacteraeota bacterium]|nr:IPT/TIG domain-containing protein [Candidatus Eremiobacteraeota bacterium]